MLESVFEFAELIFSKTLCQIFSRQILLGSFHDVVIKSRDVFSLLESFLSSALWRIIINARKTGCFNI